MRTSEVSKGFRAIQPRGYRKMHRRANAERTENPVKLSYSSFRVPLSSHSRQLIQLYRPGSLTYGRGVYKFLPVRSVECGFFQSAVVNACKGKAFFCRVLRSRIRKAGHVRVPRLISAGTRGNTVPGTKTRRSSGPPRKSFSRSTGSRT